MYLSYTGTKKELNLTRPELKEKYHFKGKEAVEVENSDGDYLMKEFGRSFRAVDAPQAKKPKKAPTKAKAKAPAKDNDALSDMGADGPARK